MTIARRARPTIIDIAQVAGVSYSTVSRVANNYPHVDPATRQRVLTAMQRLGYVANQHARSLLTGRSRLIGLLVHGLGNMYIEEVFRGVEEELARVEYDTLLYTTHRHRGREAEYVSAITRGFAEGLLLVAPLGRERYLGKLQAANIPHVLVDEAIPTRKSPSVGIPNRRSVYRATRYLLELNHRRLGFISDTMQLNTATERLKGYQDALAEFGLPYDPALVIEDDYHRPQPETATGRLLALANPPTAILTGSDPIAFRVMESLLHEHGLSVPEDVSVMGFDDIPQASLVYPRLTTVRHPMYEMGRVAARMLLERIEDPHAPPQHVELETELVIRDSCAPAPTGERPPAT
jgi:LacI family transcriptional regulator